MFKCIHIIICVTFIVFCVQVAAGSSCDTCDANACEPPQICLAGMVKDNCDCCFVCGRREGERCDHEDLNSVGFGKCGDNLECRVRNDLDWNDPPEAVCVCTSQRPLCGSDGVTYDNECQLTEARYRRRDGLRAVSADPCFKTPNIVSAPQSIRNKTGSSAAMTCEASAWPIPSIQWFLERDGTLEKLPGNNTRIVVQSRSGPETDETTSWLLFSRLAKEDKGTYICKAENDVGTDIAKATVTVTP